MWEGFNLPIVEAQALGTVGIGFDVGAHPETALHLASSMNDAISMIEHWNENQKHLELSCERAYKHVRSQFDWDVTAQNITRYCAATSSVTLTYRSANEETEKQVKSDSGVQEVGSGLLGKGIRVMRREGLIGSIRLIRKRVKGN
jgi:hypothetical protein